MKNLWWLVLLLVFSNSLWARSFYSGAQSLSLAHSGRAGLSSAEAPLLNPALLGLSQSEALLVYGDGSKDKASHSTDYGITLLDAHPSNVSSGALSYRKLRRFGGGLGTPVDGELWHGAFGKLFSPSLAFGISVQRLSFKAPGQSIPDQWNGSVGVTYLYNNNLGFAYVLDSPFQVSESVPVALRDEATHGVGLFYKAYDLSRVRLDVEKKEKQNPSQRMDVSASFEILSSESFVLRMGHRWEGSTAQNRFGFGFGLYGPRLKLEYGFQQNLKDSETMHGVDLRIPF